MKKTIKRAKNILVINILAEIFIHKNFHKILNINIPNGNELTKQWVKPPLETSVLTCSCERLLKMPKGLEKHVQVIKNK